MSPNPISSLCFFEGRGLVCCKFDETDVYVKMCSCSTQLAVFYPRGSGFKKKKQNRKRGKL